MRPTRDLLAVLLVAVVGAGAARADVDLDARQRDNLGIKTEPAYVTAVARTWPAAAQVLDMAPLVALLSELHAAESAAAASAGELARAEQLHRAETNVALKAVEAARSQAALDGSHVSTARSQLLAGWGTGIGSLSPAGRQQLLQDLLAGRASLVRAEPTAVLPEGVRIGRVQLQTIDGSRTWTAELLGPLPQISTPGIAGAYLLRLATRVPAGRMLIASLQESGAGVRGISLPEAAIVHWHGAAWIYAETRPNHFERLEVRPSASIGGEVMIPDERSGGWNVVTVGSRALLDAEQGAPPED